MFRRYQNMPGSVKSDVAPSLPLGSGVPEDYVAIRSST